MIKKDLKYILVLTGMVVLYVLMEIIGPKQLDWTVTYSHRDKNPYGAYLVNERLPDLFEKVENSNLTLYELKDSLDASPFILTRSFVPSDEDTEALLAYVANGGSAFIAADYFGGLFSDTLNLLSLDYFFNKDIIENINEEDTALISFSNPALADQKYRFQRNNSHNYFQRIDTANTTILATNDLEEAVFIKTIWGEGELFMSTIPLAFTNNYLLYQDNAGFVGKSLSYLPSEAIHWTEYYHLGRLESQSPLRYVLSNKSLKWAYYISILTLLLFIIFEAKRRQRIIPVIEPPKNTTLEFVGTMGNLYYQKGNHKNIAEKRISFFTERLNEKFFLFKNENKNDLVTEIAQKTGNGIEETKYLFSLIDRVKAADAISENDLKLLNDRLDDFKINR